MLYFLALLAIILALLTGLLAASLFVVFRDPDLNDLYSYKSLVRLVLALLLFSFLLGVTSTLLYPFLVSLYHA